MKLALFGILWINAMALPFKVSSSPKLKLSEKAQIYTGSVSQTDWGNLPFKSIRSDKNIAQERTLQEKIYVVIGVFALKNNAVKFTKYAKSFGYSAEFALNPTNNFYYVYLFSTTQVEEAEKEYDKIIAKAGQFPDVWIFNNTERISNPEAPISETPSDTDVQQGRTLAEKIYVVAGAFALKSNAIKFSHYTASQGYPSDYSLNPANNLYYVYLYSDQQLEAVKKEYQNIKSSTNLFPDLWIFNYKQKAFEKELRVIAQAEANSTDKSNVLQQTGTDGIEAVRVPEDDLLQPEETLFNGEDSTASKPLVEETAEIREDVEDYFIYPNVVDARSYKEIKSSVEVIDPARAKLIKTIEAHQLSTINDPGNSNHAIQLIAKAFGYRKVEHNLKLTQLHADSLSDYVFVRHDTILIEFPMVRLRKGDIVTMYNVFFHNDAAVMLKRSTYELNGLLAMLEENPNYRIRIHGHTNGNRRGKIIKLQKENPDFFTISEENKRGTCSAKKLSEERAITIKRYLVANGIAEDRMEVKGWGGKKMIYDKNSLDAKKNVRVEVEILED